MASAKSQEVSCQLPTTNGRTRGGHARQTRSTASGSRTTPPTFGFSGGLPTSGRVEDSIDTVDSIRLPCSPSHCFGSLHTSRSSIRNSSSRRPQHPMMRRRSSEPQYGSKFRQATWQDCWGEVCCALRPARLSKIGSGGEEGIKNIEVKPNSSWFDYSILVLYIRKKNIFVWAKDSTHAFEEHIEWQYEQPQEHCAHKKCISVRYFSIWPNCSKSLRNFFPIFRLAYALPAVH